jgi:hypothetical protein
MAPADPVLSTLDGPAFRLLSVEYALFLRRTNSSNKLAMRLVQRFLEEGECDQDGRVRYKLWEVTALPGGLTPNPYDGDFWRSYPERGIRCDIKPWDSAAHWTGPASATWKEFDGRQSADYEVLGIKLNHVVALEFLESAGLPEWGQSNAEKGPELSPASEPASSPPVENSQSEVSEPVADNAPMVGKSKQPPSRKGRAWSTLLTLLKAHPKRDGVSDSAHAEWLAEKQDPKLGKPTSAKRFKNLMPQAMRELADEARRNSIPRDTHPKKVSRGITRGKSGKA